MARNRRILKYINSDQDECYIHIPSRIKVSYSHGIGEIMLIPEKIHSEDEIVACQNGFDGELTNEQEK